ncbi:hypothetical protein BLJAPNOD_04459 [Ensifer sp. M14]|uniref:hypothetical protein n=1 Tax=Sinorhizobium sp. A49 TaxID=1945861 RepID=UPI00098574C1|nr:hypothetical protein [Sinorhizobium sp. A49]OOG69040.1 hypothetical protein B0E45_16250 [Sinorhizobium sp. A49]RDL48184.1 hypothetical protein BLJAPNOD_04459 [Ensifer sp. M14]
METGQLFFVLLVGVPVIALALFGILWLICVVKRPLLGIVGMTIVGATYCYGEAPVLLLFVPGIFACVAATKGSRKPLSKRLRKAKPAPPLRP